MTLYFVIFCVFALFSCILPWHKHLQIDCNRSLRLMHGIIYYQVEVANRGKFFELVHNINGKRLVKICNLQLLYGKHKSLHRKKCSTKTRHKNTQDVWVLISICSKMRKCFRLKNFCICFYKVISLFKQKFQTSIIKN